jgi:hypothetical protein
MIIVKGRSEVTESLGRDSIKRWEGLWKHIMPEWPAATLNSACLGAFRPGLAQKTSPPNLPLRLCPGFPLNRCSGPITALQALARASSWLFVRGTLRSLCSRAEFSGFKVAGMFFYVLFCFNLRVMCFKLPRKNSGVISGITSYMEEVCVRVCVCAWVSVYVCVCSGHNVLSFLSVEAAEAPVWPQMAQKRTLRFTLFLITR